MALITSSRGEGRSALSLAAEAVATKTAVESSAAKADFTTKRFATAKPDATMKPATTMKSSALVAATLGESQLGCAKKQERKGCEKNHRKDLLHFSPSDSNYTESPCWDELRYWTLADNQNIILHPGRPLVPASLGGETRSAMFPGTFCLATG